MIDAAKSVSYDLCTFGRGLFNQERLLNALALSDDSNEHCLTQRLMYIIAYSRCDYKEGEWRLCSYGRLDPMPEDLQQLLKVEDDTDSSTDEEDQEEIDYDQQEADALSQAPIVVKICKMTIVMEMWK